jgi:hypothetical protein
MMSASYRKHGQLSATKREHRREAKLFPANGEIEQFQLFDGREEYGWHKPVVDEPQCIPEH